MGSVVENSLVTIQQNNALSLFADGEGLDVLLAEIETKAKEFTPDVTTAKGRNEIASQAYKVARSKTYIDNFGKELVAKYKEIPKKIDAHRKVLRERLDALRDEVRQPLTEWEEKEKARVDARKNAIEAIRSTSLEGTSAEIASRIEEVEGVEISEWFQEFANEAAVARDSVLADLRAAYQRVLKDEEKEAELERLRAEAAELEAKEREERLRREAEEKARKEAELKAERERKELERKELEARYAAEKAEREKREALERAEAEKQAAIEAERARIQAERERAEAEERRKIEEAERKKQNAQHRQIVHDQIVLNLVQCGLELDAARIAIDAILNGYVKALKIVY